MLSNTKISLDGKEMPSYSYVELTQYINKHHQFEIILDNNVIETYGGHTIEKSKEWLGKSVLINFEDKEFLGLITNVSLSNKDGHHGKLSVKGYSPTILLEGGDYTCSWTGKKLETIVKETIEELGLEANISPKYKELIEYQVQYKENHYNFLQRLAKQYNDWFYSDGLKIVFGVPTPDKAINLEYGREIYELDIEIKIKDHSKSLFSYNATENASIESKSKDSVNGLNELALHAFKTSADLYKSKKYSNTKIITPSKINIDKLVDRAQAAGAAKLNVLSAKSTKQGLSVGSVVRVRSAKNDGKGFDVQNYGEYMISKIVHYADEHQKYYNSFEAIPSGIETPEEPEVKEVMAENQIAEVVSNADPKNQGRVQVKFQWQTGSMQTSWIRVMTPDAGSSDHHSKNRGHLFIPEVGDQVMVSFEYNDPNRPFVMGSMFHGESGAGGQKDNNFKSIITKSGHVIEFNDTKKEESITITDKNNNIIFIDTANSSIRISAPENISMSAKNIDISASENFTLSAGENIGINAGDDMNIGTGDSLSIVANEDLTLLAKNITEQASENFESIAVNIEEHAESIIKNSTKEDMELNSSGSINNNTGDNVKLF